MEQSQFVLTFGYCGSTLSANPQSITARNLQQEFNKHQSLPYIVQVLSIESVLACEQAHLHVVCNSREYLGGAATSPTSAAKILARITQ